MTQPEATPVPIHYEKQGALAVIQIHRPEKRNAFTVEMFRLLAEAFTRADTDPGVRCVVLHAAGDDFTTGLDLANVAPAWAEGQRPFPEDAVDPWGVAGVRRTRPLVIAVQGRCYTLGLELVLAADAVVCAPDASFNLREVRYGIYPGGGGTFRFAQIAGRSNAMRYVLTGDTFDSAEAHRMGVVQELVQGRPPIERALELAGTIAAQAPLGVAAALRSADRAEWDGWRAAVQELVPTMLKLIRTEDAGEAMAALMERRPPEFQGR